MQEPGLFLRLLLATRLGLEEAPEAVELTSAFRNLEQRLRVPFITVLAQKTTLSLLGRSKVKGYLTVSVEEGAQHLQSLLARRSPGLADVIRGAFSMFDSRYIAVASSKLSSSIL